MSAIYRPATVTVMRFRAGVIAIGWSGPGILMGFLFMSFTLAGRCAESVD